MQHIGIRLEDERGEMIETSEINFADILPAIWDSPKKEKYPWLIAIDPYGFTIFNVHQAPIVINELQQFQTEAIPEIQVKIQHVIDLINKIEQHHYIRFIGD